MKQGLKKFREFLADESGATAIEYGLLAALIGVGIIGGLKAFGNQTNGAWTTMSSAVQGAF